MAIDLRMTNVLCRGRGLKRPYGRLGPHNRDFCGVGGTQRFRTCHHFCHKHESCESAVKPCMAPLCWPSSRLRVLSSFCFVFSFQRSDNYMGIGWLAFQEFFRFSVCINLLTKSQVKACQGLLKRAGGFPSHVCGQANPFQMMLPLPNV